MILRGKNQRYFPLDSFGSGAEPCAEEGAWSVTKGKQSFTNTSSLVGESSFELSIATKFLFSARILRKKMATELNNKIKPYAAFLIDRPSNNQAQGGKNIKVASMNYLRYRLRIELNLETNTEMDTNNLQQAAVAFNTENDENSRAEDVNDTLLQLLGEFDATGIAEICRLLLERRAAIPLFVPRSKKHYLNLLRHVSLPRIDNISLLRHLADCFTIEDSTVEAEGYFLTEEKKREMDSEDVSLSCKDDDFECPPPSENDQKTEMLDLINILTVVVESWHPLFTLILLENTHLFDAITKGGKYNMDITQYGLTLLNFAIMFSTTKMVRHLLEKADPTPDESMMNALHLAAIATKETEIFDLLLAHDKVKIDDVIDETGDTALHLAACASNVIAVQKLIEKGANPNVLDKKCMSPLHVAAMQRDGCPIIDLLLEAQKVKGMGDINDRNERGETALHYAAASSNEITAEHLIKKGADLNHRNIEGHTPLHVAALVAENMQIIDVLLKNIRDEETEKYKEDATLLPYEIIKLLVAKRIASNEKVKNLQDFEELNAAKQQDILIRRSKSNNKHGLGGAMANRMIEKKDAAQAGTNRHIQATYETIREINNFKAKVGGIAHIIGDKAVKTEDKVGMVFKMTLVHAIVNSDVKTVRRLFKVFGADIRTLKWEEQKWNALHLASELAKTTNVIDAILETGKFDINGVDSDGWTPLHYALVGSNAATNARHLLEKGADPNMADKNGITPLHVAAETCVRDSDILDLIMANNNTFEIDHRNQSGMTALHIAIATSNLTTSRFLLSKGANPNVADENGFTPLHLAADFAKDMDIVKLLLNHKDTNVNSLDNKGNNALHYAMNNMHGIGKEIADLLTVRKEAAKTEESDHEPKNIETLVPQDRIQEDPQIEMIRFLIESGMDVSAMTWGEKGTNALHLVAADAKTTDLIDAILKTGKFDIDGVDNDGWTPLHHAINGSVSTKNVPRLIHLGADPSIADKNGITPLHLAARNADSTELIDIILETGKFDINRVDSDGRTPLHYAIKRPNPVTIDARRLIKMGADPGIADKKGVTSLHMAANTDSMGLIELLLNTEAVDVNCVDKQGRTPIACARNNKHGLGDMIIDRLRESGAIECDSLTMKFEKNAIIGTGTYGTVFEGEWNNKKVAVKRIELAKCENNKEEEALQKLDHPNVVKLYHAESGRDFRYYALEFCQASLDQKFLDETNPKKYCGPMPPEKEVFVQLAKGLAYIHEKGLIHRDVKPENVLICWVDSTGEKVVMKWADFGLGKQVNERGSQSINVPNKGTDNWYAPEILSIKIQKEEKGKDDDTAHQRGTVKSDVFTAGLVFGYYLLDGDHPFGSAVNVRPNIVKNNPVNLTKIKQQHPMYAIIKEMLKYNSNERISSADVVSRINNFNSCDEKKPYAAFLIDRPFNNQVQGRDKFKVALINCLRYRLRIELKLEINTEMDTNKNNKGTNSWADGVYDTLLQLISEFDATGMAEICRLLLERRAAIPLFVPGSKKHFLNLIRHVTLPRIDNISLGDKSLLRVAVISCRQMDQSQTCDILKSVFHIDSLHALDLSQSNITLETTLAEIGCGCIVTSEQSGTQTIQNVLVAHVIGDFRPLWSFLRRFADCFLIEDSTVEAESFFSSFMTEEKKMEMDTKKSMNCIWKPSLGRPSSKENEVNGFRHLYIEDQLSGKSYNTLKSRIISCLKITSEQPDFEKNRWELHKIPILEAEGYNSLECVSPEQIKSRIGPSVQNLANAKKNEFLLQKLFLQEAKHVETKMENRLKEEIRHDEDEKINVIQKRRRSYTRQVETNNLLQLFLSFLDSQDPCSRVLSIRMLETELANSGEKKLDPLLRTVQALSTSYYDKLNKSADKKDLESAKKQLHDAKSNLIESALNMEHLWRELSHLYTDTEKRSPIIQKIPQLAAQHLLDGFCLELLDGDSNLIRQEWVDEVLLQLGKLVKGKRVFVLSVMGVQSSGKSTLLNTMFGIRMRTSVGQCTRGVNMQLLAVEGRPEYDYILLLDTEGTRSPEYHGLAGSEKRDNQMATLSILLSDATIIVIPGENDAAVKEILPIVLMAYQGSRLAEENGGRLSSRIFFVYNRIDTKQTNKLDTIIQTLGTSLHEAFSQVQNMTGNSSNLKSENPFANFNLTSTDSSRSDVCILGNVNKQTKPPGDVPDEEYGVELVQFREHIHQRVLTKVEGGKMWQSRAIDEFSSYIKNVWKCIDSANFTFTFVTVMEHMMFDQLDLEYKKTERKLAETYEKSFKKVKQEMMKSIEEKNKSVPFNYFENKLRDEVHLIVEELNLNKVVADIVNKKGQEKWQLQFENMWDRNKNEQDFNWKLKLKNTYDRLFNYESRVEEYKKMVRQEINAFFKSPKNSKVTEWKESEKNKKFEEIFNKILNEAKKEFPTADVQGEIKKVFQNSNVIKKRQIEINSTDKLPTEPNLPAGKNEEDKKSSWWFTRLFNGKENDKEKKKQNLINMCYDSVYDAVNRIAAGTLCYDDTIISNVISEIHSKLCAYHLTEHSVVQETFQHGMVLTVHLMKKVQDQWEKENSVPAKLESNKENLRKNFMMVSNGVAKTKLFASNMADLLEEHIIPAFENEMVQRTFQGIRNERWLYDARFMLKHMDLHLIDLLERNELNQVLDYIDNPQKFYADVLHLLIAKKVPNLEEEWQSFRNHLKEAIEKAATVEVDKERAQTFVDHLRKKLLDGYLQSEILGSAFRIDCSGEYEDCDNEEKKEFHDACMSKLNQVLEKQEAVKDTKKYSKQLSPKVVTHMKNVNDKAALPRCDASCRLCKSLCIEAANHDTQDRPHDAVHQPAGVAGHSYLHTDELVHKTCSQFYEEDRSFYLYEDLTVAYPYRDFAKVFPGWKDPRINEELPLRQYILATYNNEIAQKYNKKPSTKIPPSYSSRTLSSIKEQLQREIAV